MNELLKNEFITMADEDPEFVDDLRTKLGLETLAERTKHIQRLENERIKNREKFRLTRHSN